MVKADAFNSPFPADPTEDDRALMRAISAGDPAALARFYDRHSSLVFANCRRALPDRADAEDLMIDIFWEIWQRQDRYDEKRSSPRTYLLHLTRSRIIDRLRTLRSRQVPGTPHNDGADIAAVPERNPNGSQPIDEMASTEQRARLGEAVRRLHPEQREALELAYFDAMSHSEVAARLGQPIGTVKSRIRQALIRLREFMQAGDG